MLVNRHSNTSITPFKPLRRYKGWTANSRDPVGQFTDRFTTCSHYALDRIHHYVVWSGNPNYQLDKVSMDLYKMKQGCQSFENFLKELNFLEKIIFMSDLIIDPDNKMRIPFS